MKYMLKVEANQVYGWTEQLSKKPGFVPISESEAKAILDAQKKAREEFLSKDRILPGPGQSAKLKPKPGEMKRSENRSVPKVDDEGQDNQILNEVEGKGDVEDDNPFKNVKFSDSTPVWDAKSDPDVAVIQAMETNNRIEGFILEKFGEVLKTDDDVAITKKNAIDIIRRKASS